MMPALERMGRVGVWTSVFAALDHRSVRDGAAHLESLGLRSLWYGEAMGREAFALGSLLLESTRETIVASGIANIYARDATAMVNGARSLAESSGNRFVLGIGVSHAPLVERRGQAYERPYAALVDYLDAMASVTKGGPDPSEPVPVVVGSLGPRMCQLATDRTQGIHPYFTPVAHTAEIRALVGPDTFLVPEQMVILTDNEDEARAIAAANAQRYLAMPNYRRMLNSQGLSDGDLDSFSDAVFEAVFAWGDADACATRVAAHLDAGADHVCVQLLGPDASVLPAEGWSRLAPALLEL